MARKTKLELRRRWTAVKVAALTGIDYEKILREIRSMGIHGNWTENELVNRPVDIREVAELVVERLIEEATA